MTDRAAAERVDATRILLANPLIGAHGRHSHALSMIRRHHDALETQLRQLFGYRLVVEPGFARLYKTGLGRGRGRPLRRPSGAPWSPRTYAYLSLVIATLLTSRLQVLLSHLIDDVRSAAIEAGIELGDSTSERRDLVAALRQLVDWGAIEEDEGHVEGFAADASSEALLFVRHEIVRHLLAVPIRDVNSPETLIDLAAAPGPGGVRHHVRRLLIETPAVLADDVDDDAWSWLRQSQRRERDILADAVGVELEIRAEGVAAIDEREESHRRAVPPAGQPGPRGAADSSDARRAARTRTTQRERGAAARRRT